MKFQTKEFIAVLLVLLLFIGGTISVLAQQKAMFTQYMFNGLIINPSYSSMDEALNVTALVRQQWVGFKGAPNTQTVSVHSPIKQSRTSLGLILMRDQIGEVISENGVLGTAAHKVAIGDDTYFALGLNAGIGKYVGQYSQSGSPSAALDPVFADQNSLRANLGFGLMLFSQKFYAGFSSPFFYYRDMGASTYTVTAYKPHYILQGGYLADLGEDIKFKPNVLLKYVNGSPVQIDLNANFLFKETLWLGASLRSMDSVDLLAEIQLSPNVQLGYSYDFTTTRLAAVERGSHEIVLNFRISTRGNSSSTPKCYF
ncbi:MAG: type IX secretion system membrane protein PorP/SprF [Daejeonella sp.]|uniref:PorP/SprF family type IX secretion system membrane protein n=1 Tax=Daejeonella sp. TaxID=2805397 RepID=UPI0027338481|nr:type IX secretion system membrane protein PorP/SprF [Daejeonella sp.]MDP3466845.1 type IX secretion system membrane protein PorP/SprF [Daejeonella sp.]